MLGYSLIQHERPINLIGRYSELFGRLAAPTNGNEFHGWVDIQNVVETKLNQTFVVVMPVTYPILGFPGGGAFLGTSFGGLLSSLHASSLTLPPIHSTKPFQERESSSSQRL